MLDFRRSDLLDELYKRYLDSYELTLETEDITGSGAYKFVLECYTRNLKADIKILENEIKLYMQFCKKERRHDVKIENINFEYKEKDEIKKLNFIKRLFYHFNKFRYESEMKKFGRIIQKYRLYIPAEWYSNDDAETEDVKDVRTDVVVSEENIQMETVGESLLLAKDEVAEVSEEDKEELDSDEQLQMKLDEFFGDVETDVREEIQE